MRTYTPKPGDVERTWHVIDAADVVLGRLASQTATLLRGKHKAIFAPHVDTGDFVIIVNAEKVALTGSKREQKRAYRHSGFPGGLKSRRATPSCSTGTPSKAVEKAVAGHAARRPRSGRADAAQAQGLPGPEHPHAAQQPQPFTISQVAQ